MLMEKPVNDHFRLGLMFAVGSALTFGMSGPFAKSLMDGGLEPDRGRHRPTGRRRAGDGDLRHRWSSLTGSAKAAAARQHRRRSTA